MIPCSSASPGSLYYASFKDRCAGDDYDFRVYRIDYFKFTNEKQYHGNREYEEYFWRHDIGENGSEDTLVIQEEISTLELFEKFRKMMAKK